MKHGFTIIEILIAASVVILIGIGTLIFLIPGETDPDVNEELQESAGEIESQGKNSTETESSPTSSINENQSVVESETSTPAETTETTETPEESASEPEPEVVTEPPPAEPEPEPEPPPPPPTYPSSVSVSYTNNGFSPQSVTIALGGSVTFVNDSSHGMWVASNFHPTHTQYPEKDSSNCLGSSFDSCVAIPPGGSWQFIFNSVGTWGYHNHVGAGMIGTVVVN